MSPRDRSTHAFSTFSAVGAVLVGPLGLGALAIAGCGKQVLPPAGATTASPSTTDVVVGDPVTAPVSTALAQAMSGAGRGANPSPSQAGAEATLVEQAEDRAEPDNLPKSWTGPIVPGLSFADALRKGRGARDAFSRLAIPSSASAKEPTIKAWYGQAQALADQASRMYAAAFHAPDAAREGRAHAIAEAAELDMTMARALDDAGLGLLPPAWRSDPAVPSTFEDIAVGPTRRWRDEARVLARQCTETAKESGVLTEAARRCAALRTGAPLRLPRTQRSGGDAGAACACAEGDPLCSASLGGWCGARP